MKAPETGHLDVWDTTLPTFGVRVSPKGTKTFMLKMDNSRRSIGRFPIISLSKARTEAKRLLAERTLGKVRPTSITFPLARDLFIEDKERGNKPRTAGEYKRLLARLRFKCQLSDLTPHVFSQALNRFTATSERDHILVASKVFFNWAMQRHYIERNPALGLSTHGTTQRSRVLTDHELHLIWRACEQTGEQSPRGITAEVPNTNHADASNGASTGLPRLPVHFAKIVQLLILTGQRRGEIAALRAEYLSCSKDLSPATPPSGKTEHRSLPPSGMRITTPYDLCTLPSALTKNKREHCFPLGALATSLMMPLSSRGSLLFPARGSTSKPFNGFSKSKLALDKLSNVYGWTLHDLRRTFATRLAELGTAPHVIERLLNHATGTVSGVSAVYNRATYLKEMREAVELWESYLTRAIAAE